MSVCVLPADVGATRFAPPDLTGRWHDHDVLFNVSLRVAEMAIRTPANIAEPVMAKILNTTCIDPVLT